MVLLRDRGGTPGNLDAAENWCIYNLGGGGGVESLLITQVKGGQKGSNESKAGRRNNTIII